jgi:hypothetical protein
VEGGQTQVPAAVDFQQVACQMPVAAQVERWLKEALLAEAVLCPCLPLGTTRHLALSRANTLR